MFMYYLSSGSPSVFYGICFLAKTNFGENSPRGVNFSLSEKVELVSSSLWFSLGGELSFSFLSRTRARTTGRSTFVLLGRVSHRRINYFIPAHIMQARACVLTTSLYHVHGCSSVSRPPIPSFIFDTFPMAMAKTVENYIV